MEYILKDAIGYRINKVANNMNTQLNKMLAKYDIAVEQRATLEIIKFEKDVKQATIAQLLGKDKTTVSRSLNVLEKKGLIFKDEIQNDKRIKVIKLTAKGEEVLEITQESINLFREKLHTSLQTHEILFLFNTLDKIDKAI
jgi:DNA-binding MarR family transcriptional regulator